MFGDFCCTFIPNNTAANGTFSIAMKHLNKLRAELHEHAGATQGFTTWLEEHFGQWGAYFASIGLYIVGFLFIVALVLCCCFPIIRNLIVNAMSGNMVHTMNMQAVQMSVLAQTNLGSLENGVQRESVQTYTDLELCAYEEVVDG